MLADLQTVSPANRGVIRPVQGADLAGIAEPRVFGALHSHAVIVRAERDEDIVAQGNSAEHCYLVLIGCLRTVALMEDGRRQIGEFLLPGDVFGWEALGDHDFGAEAVTRVVLRRYPRRSLEMLADKNPDLARHLRAMAACKLRAGRERMLLLGRKTASEQIASFLLEMADRMNARSSGQIELPMSRGDMADYLGLTIETVCRGLTQLRRSGTIAVERTRIVIRDRRALEVAG